MPGCSVKYLPPHKVVEAAKTATSINPANAPRVSNIVPKPEHLALLTSKYWGANGVNLTVSFLDTTDGALIDRIVQHMNAWGSYCNAKFTHVGIGGQVRIARQTGDGYWSYLGTDILHIPANQPTMNLEAFSMSTPESEYHRVVRHETGHTLGFPHEHMRQELVDRLDPARTIAYFMRTQGWTAQVVQEQVLTPLDPSSIRATTLADQDSIMCYQLPAEITRDGQPIRGGVDIDQLDQQFAASLYPLAVDPGNPPPPVKPGGNPAVIAALLKLISDIRNHAGFAVIIADIIALLGAGGVTLPGAAEKALTDAASYEDAEKALKALK
jgi:hypothetical protein